jgi:hypothetical protein
MIAYGKVKTRDTYSECNPRTICIPVIIKKAEERRRNKPLRYPRLQDDYGKTNSN